MDLAPVRVEPDRLAEEDGRVRVPAEDPPERLGDLAGREGAGRDLVEQRLEQVVVAPVDEGDARPAGHGRAARRVQPAEPSSDDHDAMGSHTFF